MAGLLNRLAPKGYPGQIFVRMLRIDYGTPSIIIQLKILHSWYSRLRGYLPELYGKTDKKMQEYNEVFAPLFDELSIEIDAAYELYDGSFEGQSCNPTEKKILKAMRGIEERLDVITAKAKIIDNIQSEDEESDVIG